MPLVPFSQHDHVIAADLTLVDPDEECVYLCGNSLGAFIAQ